MLKTCNEETKLWVTTRVSSTLHVEMDVTDFESRNEKVPIQNAFSYKKEERKKFSSER